MIIGRPVICENGLADSDPVGFKSVIDNILLSAQSAMVSALTFASTISLIAVLEFDVRSISEWLSHRIVFEKVVTLQ